MYAIRSYYAFSCSWQSANAKAIRNDCLRRLKNGSGRRTWRRKLVEFLGLSAGAMWALQTEESAEAVGAVPRAEPGFAFAMLLLSALAGFLFTAALFAVTPRIGIGHFLHRQGKHGGFTVV